MTASIGIFDSGIGGLSVLKALRSELPNEHFIYIADSGHAPYGERDDAHVIARSLAIAAYLMQQNIKALVVACNTATAAAIDVLRARHPNLPIIGVEPALKPAVAASKTKRIAVMATRSTLASARFAALLAAHATQARFELLPCDGLAEAIEQSSQNQNATELIATCARIMCGRGIFNAQFDGVSEIDTIVLGCTHYAFAAQHIATLIGPGVQLLDTGAAVARQARRLLIAQSLAAAECESTGFTIRQHQPPDQGEPLKSQPIGSINFVSTGNPAALRSAAQAWLGLHADVATRHF
jgi:glutamate racemase